MTTTTHDTSISWMDCPVCAELHREVERADAEADKAWETFSFFEATYREAFAAGMVGFGTKEWTKWHDLLDQLRHAYYAAEDAKRARLAAWGDSIRNHDGDAAPAETECGALRAAAAINALDDAGLCVAADLLYPILDDVTDLLRLDPHRLDRYRTQLTKTVFRRSGHESTSLRQWQPQAHSEGAHRLMDTFDDAAEAHEHALADGEGEER